MIYSGGKKRPGSRVRKRANTDTGAGIKKRKLVTVGAESGVASDLKAVKKPQGPVLGSGERSKSLDLPGYLGDLFDTDFFFSTTIIN